MHRKEKRVVAGRRTKGDVVETAEEYKRRKMKKYDIISLLRKKRSNSTRTMEMGTERWDKDGNRWYANGILIALSSHKTHPN